jgi:hypothetical protein
MKAVSTTTYEATWLCVDRLVARRSGKVFAQAVAMLHDAVSKGMFKIKLSIVYFQQCDDCRKRKAVNL